MDEAIGPTPVREFPTALSEPIWHSWTPGSYGGPPPPSSYYYQPPAAQPPPTSPQPPAGPPPPHATPAAASPAPAASGRAATGRAHRRLRAIAVDAGTRLAARVTALAAPLFLLACAVPDGGLFRAERYRDVHIYGIYADGFLRGDVPYRDVFVEYPPGAFAVFMPPAVLPGGAYNPAFKTLMALCGIAALFCRRAHARHARGLEAPALRRGWAVRALADRGRPDLAQHLRPLPGGAHGRSARRGPAPARAARLRPARARCDGEALPAGPRPARGDLRLAGRRPQPHSALARRVRGRRRARRPARSPSFARTGSGTASTPSPRAACRSRASARASCSRATSSACTRRRSSTAPPARRRETSPARFPDALATITLAPPAVAVARGLVALRAGLRGPERLVLASAAAVAGFLAFNRFVSPQYVVWLIPLVLLVPGANGDRGDRARRRGARPRADLVLPLQPPVPARGNLVARRRCATRCCSRSTCLLVFRLKTSTPSSEKTSRQAGLRRKAETARRRSPADPSGRHSRAGSRLRRPTARRGCTGS